MDGLVDALTVGAVAAEVLWSGPPVVFVGARVDRHGRSPLYEIATRTDRAPSQILEILAGDSLDLPVRAELGAVNAWRSVGPLPVPIDADAAAIENALADRVDLASCDRPVALEIGYRQPTEVWWAVAVSSQVAGRHQVDVETVVRVLRSITEEATRTR